MNKHICSASCVAIFLLYIALSLYGGSLSILHAAIAATALAASLMLFKASKKYRYATIISFCGLIITFIYLEYSSNENKYTIQMTVPNDFRGQITLLEDPSSENLISLVDGQWRLKIPDSGTVVVRDLSMFSSWHRLDAVYEDGRIAECVGGSTEFTMSLPPGARVGKAQAAAMRIKFTIVDP